MKEVNNFKKSGNLQNVPSNGALLERRIANLNSATPEIRLALKTQFNNEFKQYVKKKAGYLRSRASSFKGSEGGPIWKEGQRETKVAQNRASSNISKTKRLLNSEWYLHQSRNYQSSNLPQVVSVYKEYLKSLQEFKNVGGRSAANLIGIAKSGLRADIYNKLKNAQKRGLVIHKLAQANTQGYSPQHKSKTNNKGTIVKFASHTGTPLYYVDKNTGNLRPAEPARLNGGRNGYLVRYQDPSITFEEGLRRVPKPRGRA